jgi:hypothetical protein
MKDSMHFRPVLRHLFIAGIIMSSGSPAIRAQTPAPHPDFSWDGPVMVVALSGDAGGIPVTITQRWSLDAAGTSLTRQQSLSVGGREIVEALVFARRARR